MYLSFCMIGGSFVCQDVWHRDKSATLFLDDLNWIVESLHPGKNLQVKMVVPGQDTSPAGTSGVGSPKGPTSGTTWEATAEMVDVFWRMFLFSTIQLKRKGPSDDRKAVLGFGWDLGYLFSCQTQQWLIFQPEFSFTTYGCFETTKDEGFMLLLILLFFPLRLQYETT